MLLGKKHWAERIVGEAGVPLDGRVARELIAMLGEGARQYQKALADQPDMKGADELDFLVLAARAAPRNASAVDRLVKKFDLSPERAARLLSLVRDNAFRIFEAEGRAMPS